MTKSTRHKRARKDDLKKIKLKVGKKLRKAENETKTDFKARKIILKEQLPMKPKSSLITTKNLNINELLSRLSHHSVYVRQDGLNGLKELIAQNSKLDLGPYLSVIFTRINPCLMDLDNLIRITAIKVIEGIIIKIGSMIQPYFGFLTSYLSCAMVHLNTGVQTDSLKLMDVLLTHATSLIAQNANTILNNFFMLISRKIDPRIASNLNLTCESYTLISNPSSRLATIKWRVNLLKGLGRYIESILGEKTKLEASVPVSPWQVITVGCLPSIVRHESRASLQGTKVLTDENEAQSFVGKLVPILFQAWAEVFHCSVHEKVPSGTPLEPIAIEMLRCVSEIILHLWKMTEIVTRRNPIKCSWFIEKIEQCLQSEILDGFPYCALEDSMKDSKKTKAKKKLDWVTECQHLNINIASLSFLYQRRNQDVKRTIAQYYIDFLSTGPKIPSQKLSNVASTGCDLMKTKVSLKSNLSASLLTAALEGYKAIEDRSKYTLLKFPIQATDHACKRLWRCSALAEWMAVVIEDTVQNPKEESLLEAMLQFKLRNTPGFANLFSLKKDALREKLKTANNEQTRLKVVV